MNFTQINFWQSNVLRVSFLTESYSFITFTVILFILLKTGAWNDLYVFTIL